MPYTIETEDGITIEDIPDNIQPDDQRLKDRVAEERAKLASSAEATPQLTPSTDEALATEVAAGRAELPEGADLIEFHDPMAPDGKGYRIERERGVGDVVGGVAETALALGTGATGGIVGHIGGVLKGLVESIQSGQYGTQEGARLVEKTAQDLAQSLTYEPRTAAGQEYVQEVAETLAPLEALTPMAAEIGAVARASKPAIKSIVSKIVKPIKKEIGFMKGAIPESQKAKHLRNVIKENPTSKEIAPYKLKGNKVVSDIEATEAIKQGFEDRVISTIKSGTDLDRKNMTKMINIHKLGKKSADFAAKNRPADVVGKSIEDRVSFLARQKKLAGKDIERAADLLKGKKVNYEQPINNFLTELDDIGVKISTENGKMKISLLGSDIEGDIASKNLLNSIVNRLVETDVPDGYGVHRAKRFIDTQVSYGKTKANPLSKTTERIVKGLRRNLNESLGEYSNKYKLANTKFSDIINSLDDIQRAVGTSVDMDSPNAAKSFGLSSRKLLSNYGSRVQMIDALDNIETVAKKYGMKPSDNIVKQVIFVNEIDRMFGAAAPTSFKGQIDQAINKGVDVARRGGLGDAALDIAKKSINKARGINEENAIRAMEQLLKRKKGQ